MLPESHLAGEFQFCGLRSMGNTRGSGVSSNALSPEC